jgi:catechol 2,3-dioxygenase-like lactoylglutathione lyase family enzyme
MTHTADTTTPADTAARQHGPLLSGINHVAIVTADLDRLCTFYEEVFDAVAVDVVSPPPTRGKLVHLSPGCALALMEAPASPCAAASPTPFERGHLDHIGLDVTSAAALAEIRRRLVARGASDGAVHDYGAMLALVFTDPDGMAGDVGWLRDRTPSAEFHVPVPGEAALERALTEAGA